MSKIMDKDEIVRDFQGGLHCSQVVMKQWAEDMGYDTQDAMRFIGPLAGGCMRGHVCGAAAAALVIIGMKYGHCEHGDIEGNARMTSKVNEFIAAFEEKHGSILCRDLTKCDFAKEGELERALTSGLLFRICPDYVNTALEILDTI